MPCTNFIFIMQILSFTSLQYQISGCVNPPPPKHGYVNVSNNRAAGDTITYGCDSGYMLVGVKTRVCRDDTTWSGNEPLCLLGKAISSEWVCYTNESHLYPLDRGSCRYTESDKNVCLQPPVFVKQINRE